MLILVLFFFLLEIRIFLFYQGVGGGKGGYLSWFVVSLRQTDSFRTLLALEYEKSTILGPKKSV